MFTIISRDVTSITPITAEELLKKNVYVSQRGFDKAHAQNLAAAIKSGEFHTGEIAIAKNGNGKEYLMNGQHQLSAVVMAGSPVTALVVKANCPTPADMANFFAQFDVNKTRSISEIVRAEVNSLGVKWYDRTGSFMATSLAILLKANPKETKSQKASRVSQFISEGDFVNQFLTTENKHLKRSPVVAAMIATLWKDADDAFKFWTAVATGELLKKDDPRLRLRTYLCETTIDAGTGGATKKECRAKCIHAWNAWRNGKTTSLKYYEDKPLPALI